MPIIRRRRLGNQPRLIQRIQHLLRQRALLQILEISLHLLLAAHADDDPIPAAILDVQLRVVQHPAERRLQQRQVVLLDHGLDDAQRLERRVFEVPRAVHAAHAAHGLAEAARGRHVGGFVFAAEEAAGDRVVDDDVEAVAAAGGDELRFDGAGYGVVLGGGLLDCGFASKLRGRLTIPW